VVILNAAKSRFDALIVLADMDRVVHVPLPKFTPVWQSDAFQTSLKSSIRDPRCILSDDNRHGGPVELKGPGRWSLILAPLWKCVVQPVLDALAFSVRDVLIQPHETLVNRPFQTDSWGVIARFLVSNRPLHVSPHSCSWFLRYRSFATWAQIIRFRRLVVHSYSQHSCVLLKIRSRIS
jgi:hypothetical protein